MKYKSSSRSQKQKSHRRKSRSHTKRRSSRRVQRGGLILTPSLLSNPSNSHVAGFTDTEGALTGCIGSPNSATALRGTNVDTIIDGVKTAVHMKGGSHIHLNPEKYGGRRRSCNMKGGLWLPVHAGSRVGALLHPGQGGRRRSCNMKGGLWLPVHAGSRVGALLQDGGRRRSCNKRKCNHKYHRMQRGGSHTMNTNGYSIGGVELKPSLSGIANNYHNAYDSCRG